MESKTYYCEGPLCNPAICNIEDCTSDLYVNTCVVELNNGRGILPIGWRIIDRKVICPRCAMELDRFIIKRTVTSSTSQPLP